jgi:hypothetical protein
MFLILVGTAHKRLTDLSFLDSFFENGHCGGQRSFRGGQLTLEKPVYYSRPLHRELPVQKLDMKDRNSQTRETGTSSATYEIAPPPPSSKYGPAHISACRSFRDIVGVWSDSGEFVGGEGKKGQERV